MTTKLTITKVEYRGKSIKVTVNDTFGVYCFENNITIAQNDNKLDERLEKDFKKDLIAFVRSQDLSPFPMCRQVYDELTRKTQEYVDRAKARNEAQKQKRKNEKEKKE